MAESNLSICENSLEYFQFDPHTAYFLIIGNPHQSKGDSRKSDEDGESIQEKGELM